ncbi:MAG: NUDIX hydrolase [Acidimicrobiia bacterium]
MRDRLHRMALAVFGTLPRSLRGLAVRLIAPKFTAGTVVGIDDGGGRVLLVSHPYTTGWGMPGGLLKGSEEPAEAIAREVREELGLELSVDGHALAIRTPWRRHYNFVFSATLDYVDPAELRGHSPEIDGVDWFALDALPELSELTDELLVAIGLVPPEGRAITR